MFDREMETFFISFLLNIMQITRPYLCQTVLLHICFVTGVFSLTHLNVAYLRMGLCLLWKAINVESAFTRLCHCWLLSVLLE